MGESPSSGLHAAAAQGGERPAGPYARIERLIAAQRCVVLDGATGSELMQSGRRGPAVDERLWGVSAVLDAPREVAAVHRAYVNAGCDVVSTNTWGLPTALRDGGPSLWEASRPVHWMDVARRGVRLARMAAEEAGRASEVAVAFSVNGDIDSADGHETIRLLGRALEQEPPDLVLLETLSLVRDSTYATVQRLLDTGLPVWVSFRRCPSGVCGVYGEHWGGPEGDAFGRSALRFEELGAGALLINCIPPDHVTGMVPWLRDFTDLPLGVYPNLGYLSEAGWRQDRDTDAARYAELALQWREEGAEIIGGCCGVGPEHLKAAREALADTRPGRDPGPTARAESPPGPAVPEAPAWTDGRGRPVFPVDLPDIVVDPGVHAPTQGSFLLWKHLHREGIGAHQRCLDVGCGSGLLTVQLARNGAAHVHALDRDPAAVRNTDTNASRNAVTDRVSVAVADLFPWVPKERYDVIVANLCQVPVDPFEQRTTHRPRDFWGRNLIDHLIGVLPAALADDGVAYVLQLSIIGERRTSEQLARLGYAVRVLDMALEGTHDLGRGQLDQIARVESHSDAYHLTFGDRDAMVVYLLEVRRPGGSWSGPGAGPPFLRRDGAAG